MTQPGRGEDIVFGASVDDRTVEFFNRFDMRVVELGNKAEAGFNQIDKSINQMGPTIGVISGLVSTLTTQFLQMGMQAVNSIKQFVEGSVDLTARVDTLMTTLNLIGQNAGYSRKEIDLFVEEVKGMGITTQAAVTSLVRMARANIDWSEAATLARIAQDSAVVAGINSSEAFERLIRGIQKQEPELLDELGIQLRRSDAYARLAEQLGVTAKELDENQRQQAILNEIYRQSGVVAGAYEAAMGTVGKQASSLPRHIEELQLAIGRAFQPAESVKIQFMTERLKEMNEWFQENEESVQEFAEFLGEMSTLLFDFLKDVLDFATALPRLINDAGLALARAVNNVAQIMDDDELVKSNSRIGTSFKQLFLIVGTLGATGAEFVKSFVQASIGQLQVLGEAVLIQARKLKALVEGDIPALVAALEQEAEFDLGAELEARWDMHMGGAVARAKAAGNEVAQYWARVLFGIGDDAEAAADEVEDAMDDMGDAAAETVAKVKELRTVFRDFMQEMVDDMAERDKQAARDEIKRELQLSFRREDIERQRLKAVQALRAQYAEDYAKMEERQTEELADFDDRAGKRRLELQERLAQRRIDIEQQYQDRLVDIQDDYEYAADEAARNRDAVTLQRLKRERAKQLKEAEKTRDRSNRDAEKDYEQQQEKLEEALEEERKALEEAHAEERRELEDHLKKQIEMADKARKEAYRELDISLERERRLRELHLQWEEEDRQEAFQKELADYGRQFAALEGITETQLKAMLRVWEGHFEDLDVLIEAYVESLESTQTNIDRVIQQRQRRQNRNRGEGVYGQAGQVSMPLATGASGGMQMSSPLLYNQPPRLPAVAPVRSVERREINVTGNVAGMDPYFQRMLVNALIEVERNRGNA